MQGFHRLTPASSVRTRLGLAALVWTAVGTGLLAAGSVWLFRGGGAAWPVFLLAASVVGWLKARFVLEPRALVNAERIVSAGEHRCVGGVFSWPSWGFVAGMVVLGGALRRSPLPRVWLGLVYTAVGTALIVASRVAWRAWWRRTRS